MNVSGLAAHRVVRVGSLLLTTAGWLVVILGVVADEAALVVGGAVAVGTTSVVALKLLFESRSFRAAGREGAPGPLAGREQLDLLRRESATHARITAEAVRRADATAEQLAAALDALTTLTMRVAETERHLDASRATLTELARGGRSTAEAIGLTRSIVDKLAARVPTDLARRLSAVSRTSVAEPLLSIAIPSYNRPSLLRECLDSIEREIRDGFTDLVEVCITDDASIDLESLEVAVDFAERCRFASVHRQPANVGIERNVIAACQPCRGEYVVLFGNDDRMVEGALATMIADVRAADSSVLLYDKVRITAEGHPRAPVPGSTPIEIPVGARHRFGGLLEAARRHGFISTFGFISDVVFRRAPFVAVDPGPYLDLTMYTQVFVLIEAFHASPVSYRNVPVALQRTVPHEQRHAEAMGRREGVFMGGGQPRNVRYFGATLAAAWQRVVDRTGIDPSFLLDQPEHLLTTVPVVPWIASNRAAAAGTDLGLEPAVLADAERLLTAVSMETTT